MTKLYEERGDYNFLRERKNQPREAPTQASPRTKVQCSEFGESLAGEVIRPDVQNLIVTKADSEDCEVQPS